MDVNPTLPDMREVVRTPYGERLYKARKEHAKISQAVLATAAGTTQSNVAELELSGQGSSYTAQFAKRLGVRVEWLAEGIEPMVAPKPNTEAPQAAAHTAAEPSNSYGLSVAVTTLGKAIEEADAATREDVLGMLTLFVRNPKANSGQLPLLVARLSGEFRASPPERGSMQA